MKCPICNQELCKEQWTNKLVCPDNDLLDIGKTDHKYSWQQIPTEIDEMYYKGYIIHRSNGNPNILFAKPYTEIYLMDINDPLRSQHIDKYLSLEEIDKTLETINLLK